MPKLVVKDLVVRYGSVTAVDGVSFEVEEGELISLLGPSGCGKTTTLRCIAGLESSSAGEIWIDGEVVARDRLEVPPEKRGVNMVFQSYAIWPHLTVFDNIAYGLRIQRLPASEIAQRVNDILWRVGLTDFGRRYGTELSGGQQQRVAVARAVVTTPKLLLFDEPLSNLDAGLRERMRFELVDLQRSLKHTSLYVTHDQSEAMVMSDRIILMQRGRIEQQGSPRDLYERPVSRFVAEFVGKANLQTGILVGLSGSEGLVRLADGMVLHGFVGGSVTREQLNKTVYACIRPENLVVVPQGTSGKNVVAAEVRRVSYLGSTLHCELKTESMELRLDVPPRLAVTEGETICIHVDPAYVVIVAGDTSSRAGESTPPRAAAA